MARWRGEVRVRQFDVALLRAALPLFLGHLRELRFIDEVAYDGTHAVPGLTQTDGRHPDVGTAYHAVSTSPTNRMAFRVELLADDPTRLAVGLQDLDRREATAIVEVAHPSRPRQVTIDAETEPTRHGPWRGPLRTRTQLDLAATDDVIGTTTLISVGFAHTAWKGLLLVDIAPQSGDEWLVRCSLRGRGRWIWRPIGWFAWWTVGILVRRQLTSAVERLPVTLEPLHRFIDDHPTPRSLARAAADWLFDRLRQARTPDDPPYR